MSIQAIALLLLVVYAATAALLVRWFLALNRARARARADVEGNFFKAIDPLISSGKLGDSALGFIHLMVDNLRNEVAAFQIVRGINSGDLFVAPKRRRKVQAADDLDAAVPEDLRNNFAVAVFLFLLAMTYNAPMVGVFARSALARHLTKPSRAEAKQAATGIRHVAKHRNHDDCLAAA